MLLGSLLLSVALGGGSVYALTAEPSAPRPTGDAQATTSRPDIVVVMLDDMHAGPAERLFQRIEPIKSRFLDRGVHFTNAHNETPLCCPARANFLTGRHTLRHGVTGNDPTGLDQSRTVATALHDAGYWTAWTGKYLNGSGKLSLPPPGWDRFQHKHPKGTYQPGWVADQAADVLASAPTSKPLFAVFASTAPHNEGGRYLPRTSPLYEGDARCAGAGTWSPPSYNEADLSDKPAYIQGLTPLPFASGWPLRKACEQLLSVGDTVRNLKQELARQGRLRNTVFVLMSDNGMGWGEHRIPFKNAPYTTPLALWITWPSGRGTAPRDEGGLVSMIDLGVTLASVGGAAMPWADGLDLSALLMDAQPPITRDDMLHSLPDGHHAPGLGLPPMPGWWAVRTTSHLWIEWNDGPRELYDLRGDPWLLRSLHGDPAYGSVRAALKARLDALRSGGPN